MKNTTLACLLILFLTRLSGFGQTRTESGGINGWQPVLISHDGTNQLNGVEVSYSLTTCNGQSMLLLKLENKNSYGLKASWRNLVQTQDGKDLYGTGAPVLQVLPPSSEVKGDCSGSLKPLVIKLSDYVLTAADFKTFIAAEFELTK